MIVVRNQELLKLLDKHRDELVLHDSNADEVYRSQSAGFRHRRQGLAYRLYVHKQRGEWTPTKRVKPSLDGISKRRQQVYAMRTVLKNQSFVAFRKAEEANDFTLFNRWMKPFVKRYNKVDITFKRRLKMIAKKIIPQSIISKIYK